MLEAITWIVANGLVPHFILFGITLLLWFFAMKWMKKQDENMKRKE